MNRDLELAALLMLASAGPAMPAPYQPPQTSYLPECGNQPPGPKFKKSWRPRNQRKKGHKK